jgi:hypothetical protein
MNLTLSNEDYVASINGSREHKSNPEYERLCCGYDALSTDKAQRDYSRGNDKGGKERTYCLEMVLSAQAKETPCHPRI